MSSSWVIEVFADWQGMSQPAQVGSLHVDYSRGKEIFSFEYDQQWLSGSHAQQLDPNLQLFQGRQYAPSGKENFGVFLDSCPDRWGRVLMLRREAQLARAEGREEHRLQESDFLLGVHDSYRMGGLRFRISGNFLDDQKEFAAPPWTSLRELENASLQLEKEGVEGNPQYSKWLRMLLAPGGSLGGARPKASVVDQNEHLWIAKFPSKRDRENIGAWEAVVHELAKRAGVDVPEAQARKFASSHHTFLSKRFDRTDSGERIHFASAMILLQRDDGEDASDGVSYLELAELLMQQGSNPDQDLEQLWRRQVFFVCVSNADDHLRNHGFILNSKGWTLAPAYDMNPDPNGEGLKLNISESDNSQDLQLLGAVAPFYRLSNSRAQEIQNEVMTAVRMWRQISHETGLAKAAQDRMRRAFRISGL